MKYRLSAALAASLICPAPAAFAQSDSTPPPPAAAAPPPAVAPAAPPAVTVGGGKRAACLSAAQGVRGQDKKDQMQLCMAQARVDCLKQAINQNLVGPQRRDFVKNCVREE